MYLVPALIALSVGAGLAELARRLYRRLRPEPSCTWCATASAWPVRGHDTLLCRGYVHMVRERTPEYGGNLWRDAATDVH
ncbi:hypothetical protein [Streptomyces sp. NPDC001404]|uniref:hypothetical protein n=1 Tax=Streptomyces sp. NPDC001404 TaxID=3364571 RepID=UPI003696EAD2